MCNMGMCLICKGEDDGYILLKKKVLKADLLADLLVYSAHSHKSFLLFTEYLFFFMAFY